jgi:hypothetical protein
VAVGESVTVRATGVTVGCVEDVLGFGREGAFGQTPALS